MPDTSYDARNGDSISFAEDQVMLRLSGVVRVQLIGNDGHLPVGGIAGKHSWNWLYAYNSGGFLGRQPT